MMNKAEENNYHRSIQAIRKKIDKFKAPVGIPKGEISDLISIVDRIESVVNSMLSTSDYSSPFLTQSPTYGVSPNQSYISGFQL